MTLYLAIAAAVALGIAAIAGWWKAYQRGKVNRQERQWRIAAEATRDRAIAQQIVDKKTADAALEQRDKFKRMNEEIKKHVANYPDAAAAINAALGIRTPK